MTNDKYQMPSYSKGFTLIEILVVMGIMGLLFGIGSVSFRDFSRRQALSGAVKQIQGDLRLAQSAASSGQKPTSGTCTQLNGYTVAFSTNSYKLTANCINNINVDIKTVSLTNLGVTESNNSVQFKVLGQGTNLSANMDIVITQNGTGNQATLTITPGGEIK